MLSPSLCWSLRHAPTRRPGFPSTDGSRYSMTKVRTGVRSTLPGRYGQGLGFVTKNFGNRKGALTQGPRSTGYRSAYAAGKRRRKGSGRVNIDGQRAVSRQGTAKRRLADGKSVERSAFDV